MARTMSLPGRAGFVGMATLVMSVSVAHAAHAAVPPTEAINQTVVGTLIAIKSIGGFLALLVLAYLGSNRRVIRLQERLGISGVITAGFPFVALGLIAARPEVGILNATSLGYLRPILSFGLGWLGFIIGAQLDIRQMDRFPRGTAYLQLVEAIGPFATAAAACGAVMVAFGRSLDDEVLWRNLVLIGTAAAMTAPRKFRGFANQPWREGKGSDVLLSQLDEIVGVIGLLFVTAFFREGEVGTWSLPDAAWMFVSVGLGVTIGAVVFALLRLPTSNAEFLAIVLGSIAFASGLASFLHLSAIAVCFFAGVLVTNFPNEQRESVYRILNHLERPVHLLFLIVVGAVWNVTDWRGWVLVPLFVAGRILGKWLGVRASSATLRDRDPAFANEQRMILTPLSGLAIALVLSVQDRGADPGLDWVITAVIGSSILSELILTRLDPRELSAPMPAVPAVSTSVSAEDLDLEILQDEADNERDVSAQQGGE